MPRRLLCALLLAALALRAAASPAPEIEVFTREGCPHCAAAEGFLATLQEARPELRIARHDVGRDPAARDRLRALSAEHGLASIGVPTFLVGGRLVVGFGSAETSGREILAALEGREPEVVLPILGAVDERRLGLPLLTVAIGLLDGFNPCAMWVLLFLVSLLAGLHDRRRMLLVAGTFVAVSGIAYFLFMLAWLNVFLLIGASRTAEIVLGGLAVGIGALHLKDAAAPGVGPSLSIPESAKPTLYRRLRAVLHAERPLAALVGATLLAVLANLVELGCTAGLPAVYTRILTLHELPTWQYVSYLLLYIAAYLADDAAVVAAAVVTLSRRRLQERGGRGLQLLSGAVMLVLGLVLWLAPGWLGG